MSSVLLVGFAGNASLRLQVLTSGHDLYSSPDVERALAVASLARPNVVLYDLTAAGPGPAQFARRLRETPGCDGALLVALTPRDADRFFRLAAAPGFDLYLSCPPDPRELSAILGPPSTRWRAELASPDDDDPAEAQRASAGS